MYGILALERATECFWEHQGRSKRYEKLVRRVTRITREHGDTKRHVRALPLYCHIVCYSMDPPFGEQSITATTKCVFVTGRPQLSSVGRSVLNSYCALEISRYEASA